jgi:UDP-3-O-[3-hydroxymyristoyl] glucosamine N-acyltransferase
MVDSRFHENHGPYSVRDIADKTGCGVVGDGDVIISDVGSLADALNNEISFLDNVKYKLKLPHTKSGAVILHPDMVEFAPKGTVCLTSKTPYKSYALAAALFYPYAQSGAVHPTASIGESVTMGDNVTIEANSVISDGVVIGDGVYIGANVTITHAIIGDHVHIHNGARIGQDGFGFALDPAGYVPVPQLGRVVIGNHVSIGSNTCIDRGAGPDTVIGDGTIIDNLCQIAHNVKIGKGCVITAQVGISGSTEIADYCVFGGQSGVAGHLKIGMGVQVGAQSGVTKDVLAGQKIMGFPARPIREFWREMAQIKKLLSK